MFRYAASFLDSDGRTRRAETTATIAVKLNLEFEIGSEDLYDFGL